MKQIVYFVQIHAYFLLVLFFRANFADAAYLYKTLVHCALKVPKIRNLVI